MTAESPTAIELSPPEVLGNTVRFRFRVTPPTEIYRETGFHLTFPHDLPLHEVPQRLWWIVFMLCIHSHWALLRPCVIYLPTSLAPGELDVWTRLLQSYADTLDALNHRRKMPRDIRIVTREGTPERLQPLPERGHCAAAFSGGKDSLAQTGLLLEMGFKPVLVAVTSPMEGDHLPVSVYRAAALAEMRKRCGLQVVEVHSDLRGNLENLVSRQWGYPVSLNEITDTLLYMAAMVVTGYVLGATRLFLASENEVSANHVADGKYLQHTHFMYSALTLAAISALLEPFGMQCVSLSTALHSNQVQELVVRRYPHLGDLQCSCWLSDDTRKACSVCSECKRLAWVTLSLGGSPAELGVDLLAMLLSYANPEPERPKGRLYVPNQLVSDSFKNQVAHAILSISSGQVQAYLAKHHPGSDTDGSAGLALEEFAKLQAMAREDFPAGAVRTRCRAAYLELLDDGIREKLAPIFADQFQMEEPGDYAEQFDNLTAAIRRVTQPVRRDVAESSD